MEEEENNMEVKEASDENEELCAMGVADAEAKQRRRELEMEIEDTQNQIENCHDDQREDLEKQMMVFKRLREEIPSEVRAMVEKDTKSYPPARFH